MVKIFSGITLLAAAAAIFFGLQSKGMVEKLQIAAEREHNDLNASREKVKKVEKELTDTKAELTAAKDEVEKTKEALTKAEGEAKKAMGELTAATAELDDAKKKVADLDAKIKEMVGNGDPAEMTKQITAMKEKIPELESKVSNLEKEEASLKVALEDAARQKKAAEDKVAGKDKTIERYTKNIMEKGTRGSVLAVNTGWGFCVLSIGDRKGAAANKVLIVARGGTAIGKVRITSVEANQSVADILPMSFVKGNYVEPGDEVIFTGDDKVRGAEEPAGGGANAPANSGAANPLGVPPLPLR